MGPGSRSLYSLGRDDTIFYFCGLRFTPAD